MTQHKGLSLKTIFSELEEWRDIAYDDLRAACRADDDSDEAYCNIENALELYSALQVASAIVGNVLKYDKGE